MLRSAGRAFALAAALVLFPGLAAAKDHQVSIEGMKFVPETVEVAPGDTVTWTNKDFVPHTVSAGKALDRGERLLEIRREGQGPHRVRLPVPSRHARNAGSEVITG
jgi:plastocyanin